jgi:hypothetical protein
MIVCHILGRYHGCLPHRYGNPPQPIRRLSPAVTMPNVVNGIQNLWLLVLAQQVELAKSCQVPTTEVDTAVDYPS